MAQILPQTPNIRSDPKFSKSLTGDFTFDLECARSRCPPFLARNVRRLLSYHQKSLRTDSSASHHENREATRVRAPRRPRIAPIEPGSLDSNSQGQVLLGESLPIRIMETTESAARRSTRRLQQIAYDNDLAELCINLSNIRKLLDFTSNRPEDDERPQKRFKKDHVNCQCSLTIWDNRPNLGSHDAIVKKSVFCSLTSVDNGAYGPCVFISLDKPFVIKASELKLPTYRDGEARLEIVENYFVEFKIIPTRSDVSWPPIPILGKSDGDHYIGPGKLPSEALAGALVMKYKELPQAPDPNTPLRAFFLYKGLTFKTKYGLEVSALWKTPEKSNKDLLNAQHGIGIPSQIDTSKSHSNVHETSKPKDRSQGLTPSGELSLVESVKRRRRTAKVIYHFEPNTCRSQEVLKQYRTAEVNGLVCPACPTFKAENLQELRFHFLMSHHKYNFTLAEVAEDDVSGEPREVIFEVTPVPLPKPTSRPIKLEQEFEWVVQATPFDLAAFLDGDTSWLGVTGEPSRIPARKALLAPASDIKLLVDSATDQRSRNGGFLPADDVRDFRKPKRKKHPVIRLVRRIDDKVATYNSINHRQTFASEEPMSDTDDEVEDEWFIQRHLENLNLAAKEESWDSMKWELFRRWDRHRLEEKLEHSRFLSDSLIRFVRKEKRWLARDDETLQAAFQQLLTELNMSRFINAAVSTEVRRIISRAKIVKTTLQQPIDEPVIAERTSLPDIEIPDPILQNIWLLFRILQKESHLDSQEGLTETQLAYFEAFGLTPTQLNNELRRWDRPALNQPAKTLKRSASSYLNASHSSHPSTQQKNPTPFQEVRAWRLTVLERPPGYCGACSQPILNRITEAIRCHNSKCPTINVWFHLKCVKLKKRKEWVCRGCRAEAKLSVNGSWDGERTIDGNWKGKGRAD